MKTLLDKGGRQKKDPGTVPKSAKTLCFYNENASGEGGTTKKKLPPDDPKMDPKMTPKSSKTIGFYSENVSGQGGTTKKIEGDPWMTPK